MSLITMAIPDSFVAVINAEITYSRPFMQSLSLNPETCKTQSSYIRNEVFKASKISFCCTEEAIANQHILENFKSDPKDYGPIQEQHFKAETLPKPQILSKGSSESFKNSLKNEETHSSIKINLTNPKVIKRDVLKDAPEVEKTLKCFFRSKKVGEIVSTSRSGHLIERRGDSCFIISGEGNADAANGCDSNDNIIEPEKSSSEMHDINDNPSARLTYQQNEEETSLSDNAKSVNSDFEAPCGIGLLERLIRSHPVWFLPGIQRAGAVHLLQGKEEGNFIVRQSSQPDTMAVSVRLPLGKGPYIEHYLIQAVEGQLSLESSENKFESIPSLIAHYCQCCDELPVQLTLPRTIRDARNRQQLSSLALLGQEFWRYPMANPRPPESRNSSPNSNKSDSLSFDGVKKLVKQSNDIVLDLVPLQRDSQPSSLSTFKSSPVDGINSSTEENKPKRPHTLDLISTNSAEKTGVSHSPKTPPQPPPRWTKPTSLITKQLSSSFTSTVTMINSTSKSNQNIVIEEQKQEILESPSLVSSTYPAMNSTTPTTYYDRNVSSPQSDQTNLKSFGFERDISSLKYFQESRKPQLISPVSDNTSLVSKGFEKVHITPSPASTPTEKVDHVFKKYKRDTKTKESAHYQECDILESPTLYYYKSNVADKQSDYEDIWATESFTTFKPNTQTAEPETRKVPDKLEFKKPPDLLEKLDAHFKAVEKKEEKGSFTNCDNGDQDTDGAQNSPFYAEPADALVVRRKAQMSVNKSRHSDPFSFNNWSVNANPYLSGGNVLDRIDSQTEMGEETSWKGKSSLSFDNIVNLKKKDGDGKSKVVVRGKNAGKAKPVRPPKVDNGSSEKNHQNWTVDSSWEFIGNEEGEKEGERRFPSIEQQMDSEEAACKYTVQEIITQRFPQFRIARGFGLASYKNTLNRENMAMSSQTPFHKSDKSGSRISAYDNLTSDRSVVLKTGFESERNSEVNCDNITGSCLSYDDYKLNDNFLPKNQVLSDTLRLRRRVECGSVTEDNEDAQTIFSEPWDSSRWENLIPTHSSSPEESCFESHMPGDGAPEVGEVGEEGMRLPEKAQRKLELSMLPLTGLKGKEISMTGASIRSYALHLASDKSTTFAQNIDNFIECTLESKETNPQIVMRNMRQFMSGMKNYLVKHGEREFEKQVEKERMKLKSTEFLNLDAILEGVMHKLVVRPLREHLYKLFVDEYFKGGAIQLLYDNLIYARTKSLHDLGLRTKILPPSQEALDVICHYILKLQEVDSPLEKLDHLLACVSTIIHSVKSSNQEKPNVGLGADDILPLFVWVLVQSGFIAAEIESEYMWGLLHPSLLSGEGCYYLTTLSSAVHVLKNLKSCDLDQSNRVAPEWHCGELKSVLKIIVPDELHGSILTKTLPVKPNMTTKDVCKIIAHKIRITNPQDYGLFRLVDGEETLLNDNECPQDVKSKLLQSGKHCTLAYKRIDAKIGWPRTT